MAKRIPFPSIFSLLILLALPFNTVVALWHVTNDALFSPEPQALDCLNHVFLHSPLPVIHEQPCPREDSFTPSRHCWNR